MEREYVMYQGDDVIAIGTAEEIAKKLNIKSQTVVFYNSNAHRKRLKGTSGRIAVRTN